MEDALRDKQLVLELYRTGYLVPRDEQVKAEGLEDAEVLRADAEGLLVGSKGFETIKGTCPACGWKDHKHHKLEDGDASDIQLDLQLAHDIDHERNEQAGCCLDPLNFESISL